MLSSLSSSSLALLERWTGAAPEASGLAMPSAVGPVIRKIADPVAPAALAVELLDDALNGRGQRRRRKGEGQGVAVVNGKLTVDGRACCGELFTEINRMLSTIALPGDFTCNCGTSYRVEMRTREDRNV